MSDTPRAHLAFLLHMHQPEYTDPLTGRAELPWVRLHGGRSYLDMARLLDEYREVRLTVNFVPSLVAQLEAVVAGARDAYLDVAERAGWTPEERRFLVERFFSVHWGRCVETRPRYRELLEKRGRSPSPEELGRRAGAFSDEELRDLTVLFHLAWLGFAARENDRDLAALEAKGRGYDAGDLALVVARGRAACARVLPLYRALAARGQIELSASPFYHPIVPLLCDTEAAHRARPDMRLPAERFSSPDDGRLQIARGKAAHARTFGEAPRGMWPPEGSVSPEAVAAYRAESIGWLATDEGNLWRSLPGPADRGVLYRAWRYDGVDIAFRDREMSDRIGFSYAFGDPRASVDDLLGRAAHAAELGRAQLAKEGLAGPPLVAVVLDGENPWEAYPGNGEPFLRALFERLTSHATLATATMSDHLAATTTRGRLERLHSGSWIDSDFHIWIGDPVKNRGWDLLASARRSFEEASRRGVAEAQLERAREHLLAAEGSDWFWWFGEPFHSAEDALFDRLFRAHLMAMYRALGDAPPGALERPVAEAAGGRGGGAKGRPPRALVHPRIDGRSPSYFEWHDAGRYEAPRGAAMAQAPVASALYYGFDRETLYLRIDPAEGARAQLLAATVEVRLTRTAPGQPPRELLLRCPPGAEEPTILPVGASVDGETAALERPLPTSPRRAPAALTAQASANSGTCAAKDLFELSLPFAAIGARAREQLSLAVRLLDGETQLARLPDDGTLDVEVPDETFEAAHWTV